MKSSRVKELLVTAILLLIYLLEHFAEASNKTVILELDDEYEFILNNGTEDGTEAEAGPSQITGKPISIRNAPWQVAVMEDNSFVCGGSVIGQRWILTAAHCVDGERGSYWVRGATRFFRRRAQERDVDMIVKHGSYDPKTSQNDIAMLRLRQPLRFNRNLKTVQLPRRRSRLPPQFAVAGWGVTAERGRGASSGLRRIQVALLSRSVCQRNFQNISMTALPKNTICASTPCQGDTGSPLVRNGIQYGIVSIETGCARRNAPGIYTDVRRHRAWINRVRQRY